MKIFFNLILIIFFSITISLVFFHSINTEVLAQKNPNSDPNDPGKQGVNAINIGNQIANRNFGVPAPAQGGIVGTVLKNAISLLFIVGGVGVLVYFIWGALDWILSGGDKEKVASARKKITNAIIGLILLSLSYFIVGLVGDIVGYNPLQSIQIKSLGEQ